MRFLWVYFLKPERLTELRCMVVNGLFFTRGQFWPSGIVVACVCLCVRVCVYQSLACPRDDLGPIESRITKFGSKMQKHLG